MDMEPDADVDYMGDLSHFLPLSPSSSPSRKLGRRKQPPVQAQAKRGKGVPWPTTSNFRLIISLPRARIISLLVTMMSGTVHRGAWSQRE
ncbi:hypothetical protein C2845_PM08G09550 [Panicum miliaceum]|uniref:Uncharacterized protein n=1 Tax=Panicum miliaceum TaxID=4540 RepID=A0A3L6QWA6_PANMI|nr:hypothetical protein C2845_PM08G09550 [Panicum miliaceum]